MSPNEVPYSTSDPLQKDFEKFDRIRNGDMSAMSHIFRKYYSSLYFFAAKFVREADLAENMVQDVFLKVWTEREKLQIRYSVKSLLYTMVRNHCLNFLKSNKIIYLSETDLESSSPSAGSPEDDFIKNETEERIHRAIDKLPGQCRQIYLMKRYDNLKYTEISEILNISVNSVKTQMKRAIKFLLRNLKHLNTCFFNFLLKY